MSDGRLLEAAPADLRHRIDAALAGHYERRRRCRSALARAGAPSFFGGFAVGTGAVDGDRGHGLVLIVLRNDVRNQRRRPKSYRRTCARCRPDHLTDVETSDQHTVKPWFNGKLDVAPPVVDLTAQGFTLVGGRLDFIDGEPAAAIVYRRRKHVINLFIAEQRGSMPSIIGTAATTVNGYNVRHWTKGGLAFWAVSDVAPDELDEFVAKIAAAVNAN